MSIRHSFVAVVAAAAVGAPLALAAQTVNTPGGQASTASAPDRPSDSQKGAPASGRKPADPTTPNGTITSKGSTSRRQNTAADGSKADHMTHDTATDQPAYSHATPGATPSK